MTADVINFKDKFELISKLWSPKIIAQLNNYHFKLARIKGDFTWHIHKDTDEAFIIIKGQLHIDYRDRRVTLKEGEMHVVSKGIEHKPYAPEECRILLIEPAGTVNTGDSEDDRKAPEEWI